MRKHHFILIFVLITLSSSMIATSIPDNESKVRVVPVFELPVPTSTTHKLTSSSEKGSSYETTPVIITLQEPYELWDELGVLSSSEQTELYSLMRFFVEQDTSITSKHVFGSRKWFSAVLSSEQYETLRSHPFVASVTSDTRVSAFLDDSVPLIQADVVWEYQVGGENLTGEGEVVCVIDSGIDYTHPELGGCSSLLNVSSDEYVLETPVTSPLFPSNYSNNFFGLVGTISHPGADSVEVVFDHFDVELNYDYVLLYDQFDNLTAIHTGTFEDPFSSVVPGDTINVVFQSDSSVTQSGFRISSYFAHNISEQCDKVVGGHDFAYNTHDPMDVHGHGTHVAGIIAANSSLRGVAPSARLVAVKSLNDDGDGFLSDVAAGIEYCTNNAQKYNISVISMSLGGGSNNSYCDDDYPFLSEAIDRAVENNISVIVATGNDGFVNNVSAPACIERAIRVSSTTKTDQISEFSNRWGLGLLMAPGTSIYAPIPSEGYGVKSGTSMATPHVSGAFALLNQFLRASESSKTPFEKYTLFAQTGVVISGDGRNYSRIDVLSALQSFILIPVVNITSPSSDGMWFASHIDLEFVVNDDSLQCVWSANAGVTNNSMSCYDPLSDQVWDQGSNTVTVYALDIADRVGFATRQFFVDTITPVVDIVYPSSDFVWLSDASTQINYSVIDDHVDTCSYLVQNDSMNLLPGCQNITGVLWPQGSYNVTVVVNDSAGNTNQTTRVLNIDSVSPHIDIVSPWQTVHNSSELLVSINASDDLSGVVDVWYSWNDTHNVSYEGPLIMSFPDGTHTLHVWANDTAGNTNTTNITFTIDTTPAQYTSILTNLSFVFNESFSYVFSIVLVDASGVDSAVLFLKSSLEEVFSAHPMSFLDDVWVVLFSNVSVGNYSYVFWANDTLGNEGSLTSISTFRVVESLNESQVELSNSSFVVPSNASQIIVDSTSYLENVTIPSNVSSSVTAYFVNTPDNKVLFSRNTSFRRVINDSELVMIIPVNTTMFVNDTWDGLFVLPEQVFPTLDGVTVFLGLRAGGDQEFLFDAPVQLVLQEQSGRQVGWLNNTSIIQIATVCNNASTPTNIFPLVEPRACIIEVGEDVFVFTHHFSTFVSYNESADEVEEEPPSPTPSRRSSSPGGGSSFSLPIIVDEEVDEENASEAVDLEEEQELFVNSTEEVLDQEEVLVENNSVVHNASVDSSVVESVDTRSQLFVLVLGVVVVLLLIVFVVRYVVSSRKRS